MKRRSILGAAVGSIGIPKLAQGTSLYGTPFSVSRSLPPSANEPLRLSLDAASIPSALSDDLAVLGTLWERVLTNPDERNAFRRDPAAYLLAKGISKEILESRDQEARILLALCNEDILAASVRGDYRGFLDQLAALGVVRSGPASNLKRKVTEVLRKSLSGSHGLAAKAPGIAAKAVPSRDDPSVLKFIESREIQYIYSQIAPSIDQVAAASVPVAIAAIVVTYVSVATTVTVAILAGVYLSVAVASAITANGGCMDNTLKGPLLAGPVPGPLGAKSWRGERERNAERAFAERALIGKRMLALDPVRFSEAQQLARIARMLNQDNFILEANRQLVRDEIDAFVEAAEELKLIRIPSDTRDSVVDAMKQVALRVAGLN